MTDAKGHVSSCGWYLNHENTASVDDLRVRNCPLARVAEWRDKLYAAVESEIARARRDGLYYAELGGWAVSKEHRCTSEGLMLALAGYGLSRLLGGAIGITAANVTHASSSILRRLGGSYLEVADTTDARVLRSQIQHDDRTLAVRLQTSEHQILRAHRSVDWSVVKCVGRGHREQQRASVRSGSCSGGGVRSLRRLHRRTGRLEGHQHEVVSELSPASRSPWLGH